MTPCPGAQYFEVSEVAPRQSRPDEVGNDWEADQKEIEEMEARAVAENGTVRETEEAREPHLWLNRVGWAAHLAGLDREKVRGLIALPGDEEVALQVLGKAFEWLIQDSQYNTVREVVGIFSLFMVNKKEVDVEPRMPFTGWMDITTVTSYVDVWKRLLLYVFRAEALPANDRPAYRLTDQQEMTHEDLKATIDEFMEWKADQHDNSGGDEGSEEESEEEIERMGQIQRKILRFCMALLNQPLGDNEYKSVIISGMAVLGMRDDKFCVLQKL